MLEAVDNFMNKAYDIECAAVLFGLILAMCAYIVMTYYNDEDER